MPNNTCVIPENLEISLPTTKGDPILHDIKKMLRLRMNGPASTAMRKSGLDYKLNYGLDAVNIREIASRYQPSETLANKLWKENSRECKILATMLYPKNMFTTDLADIWLQACFLPELKEQLCFNLLQHLSFAPEKAWEWIQSSNPETKEGGYTLALRLLLKKTPINELKHMIEAAMSDQNSENYRLKLTSSRFLERATF